MQCDNFSFTEGYTLTRQLHFRVSITQEEMNALDKYPLEERKAILKEKVNRVFGCMVSKEIDDMLKER